MKRLVVASALVAVLVPTSAAGAALAPAGKAGTNGAAVSVALDRTVHTAGPGEKFSFESTVRNIGDQPLTGLIAHVSILSSDPDIYVDPEDWSPQRTQFLDELSTHEDVPLTWDVQAVTSGPLIIYVAVTEPDAGRVAVSAPLQVTVQGRRVVNSDGVLRLAMGVPAAVLLLLGLAGLRRRRQS